MDVSDSSEEEKECQLDKESDSEDCEQKSDQPCDRKENFNNIWITDNENIRIDENEYNITEDEFKRKQ